MVTVNYKLNVCVPPQILMLNPHANVMLFEDGAFGRCLGHEGKALMNVISVLVKETPESFLTPSTR